MNAGNMLADWNMDMKQCAVQVSVSSMFECAVVVLAVCVSLPSRLSNNADDL